MNTRLYLELNHFARQTTWAHPFMSFYALYGGVIILGLLIIASWWRSRTAQGDNYLTMARSLWVGVGTITAVIIAQPINHLVAEPRPYRTLHGVEVLVPRANDFSFPSDHATVAGAVIVGLWLVGGQRLLAWLATVVGLFLTFARVYVGAHYPLDVLGGLIIGGLVIVVLRPIAVPLLQRIASLFGKSPLWFLVEDSSRHPRIASSVK